MVQTYLEQDQGRDPVQEEIEGIEEEGSFHIQIKHGKSKTGIDGSVQT
jgi:hypothetical protein